MATQKKNTTSKSSTKSGTSSRSKTASTATRTGKRAAETEPAKKGEETKERIARDRGVIDNIWGIIFIVLGIFIFAAVKFNAAGQLGNVIGNFLKGTLGHIGLVLPFYLIVFGVLLLLGKTVSVSGMSVILATVMLLMICIINSERFISPENIQFHFKEFYAQGVELKGGGFFGMIFASLLVKYTGRVGLYSIAAAVILVCLLLIINTPISRGIEALKNKNRERAERREEKREEKRLREEEERAKQEQLEVAFKEDETAVPPAGAFSASRNPFKRPESAQAKTSAIINIMNDDANFEKAEDTEPVDAVPNQYSPSFGLEPQRVTPKGLGLGYEGDSTLPYNPNAVAAGQAVSTAGSVTRKATPKIRTAADADVVQLMKEQTDDYSKSAIAITEENQSRKAEKKTQNSIGARHDKQSDVSVSTYEPDSNSEPAHENVEKISNAEAKSATLQKSDFNKVRRTAKYKKPSLDLLKTVSRSTDANALNAQLQAKAQILEDTLRNFNVDAKVVQVTQGPAVTRYEIQPSAGVKVSRITNLANDIALNLEAKSIRIEAPIPGKAAVGIEVENESVNMVTLREILESREFKQSKSKIAFAVGRDIAGKAIVADLKSMPHLLIAGSTGSGKSVCINSIITSILYKADPEEVRLILIDPKVVELGNYAHIPHLLIPVVTDATKAAAALNWAVSEMTERYKKFAEARVRDIEGYNDYVEAELERRKNSNDEYDSRAEGVVEEKPQKLPQIVIIIDELADLMLAAPSQVEESIQRIAQLARAAGMHLIVATQRPSVDVITGVIKNNIPSRIAFAVPSQHDSKTILDKSGAEKLVGKGDMLYHPLGEGTSIRVQGCFISDEEIQNVINFVEAQTIEASFHAGANEVVERGSVSSASGGENRDDLYDDAVAFVVAEGKASTSLVQRRFRIGYNRAANIIDQMEAEGIIGPPDGSKPRQVLLTQDRYDAEHGINN